MQTTQPPLVASAQRFLRTPAVWIAAGALALCGVAGASYLVGRSATQPDAKIEAAASAPAEATAAARSPAPVCADCGVVESVQAVQRKGEGSGVGAVAGGVIGGALGHQVGDGQGRTAMTVLGAIGGGFAGNEVEKRARATTVYRVRVRTDNGTLRTLDQASAPAVGQRVRIEGHKLQLLSANKATG
jgi:outer membrane lipoprotein SlyB